MSATRCRRPVPRRVPVGRGDGRPPDRGGQRQQRLVGLGAQPRVRLRGVQRGRLRLVPPLARRRRPRRRPRARRLPLLARSGAASSRPRASGRRPPSTTTAGSSAACLERGIQPVVTLPPLHHPPLAGRPGRLGGAGRPRAVRPVRRARAAAAPRRSHRLGVHASTSPTWSAVMGYTFGVFPPGVRDDLGPPCHRRTRRWSGPTAWPSTRCAPGPGTFPVGLTLSMAELVAEDGGRGSASRPQELLEDTFLRATAGDDFIGVQCYTRIRFGADGAARAAADGVPVTQMGYEYWPQALEYTVRRAAEVTGDAGGRHRERHRHRRRRPSAWRSGPRPSRASPLPGRRRGRAGLLRLEPARQLRMGLGYGPKFGLVAVDRQTFERRPKPSAAWFGQVARDNVLG